MYVGKKNDDIQTPNFFYQSLNKIFHFDFDPCPINYLIDGLKTNWKNMNFVNPPFSMIPNFLNKAIEQKKPSVFLIPVRCNSIYWKDILLPNVDYIWIVNGYLKFEQKGKLYKKGFSAPICLTFLNFPKSWNKKLEKPDIKILGCHNITVLKICK